jgi:hypothetical protein
MWRKYIVKLPCTQQQQQQQQQFCKGGEKDQSKGENFLSLKGILLISAIL